MTTTFFMVTFGEALRTAVSDTFCVIANQVGGTAGLIGDSIGRLPFDDGLTGNVQNFFQALSQVSCGDAPVANGAVSPGFSGGQCEGVPYRATFAYERTNPNTTGNGFRDITGPVRRGKGNHTGNPDAVYLYVAGLGEIIPSAQTQVAGVTTPGRDINWTSFSVARLDGQPDNCGNPDSPVVPYNPGDYTYNPDITYDDPGGNPITIPVGLIFAPVFINANAEVNIPVKVEVNPEINLYGELNLTTGDFNLNLGKGGDPCEGTDDTPSDDEDGPIIAVRVDITNIEPGFGRTEILPVTPSSDSLWVPRLASVRFLTEAGSSTSLHWTKDVDVRMTQSVVECPVHWGARRVVVEPSPGVDLNFTPIYAKSIRQLLIEKT